MGMSVGIALSEKDLRSLSKRIGDLARRAQDLTPFFDTASTYMVNSVQHRIFRSKRGPDGKPWARLSEATISIKGHGSILFHTGALGHSITKSVDRSGFLVYSDLPYASFMQHGVNNPRGIFVGGDGKRHRPKNKTPARPFMGFSDRNVKMMSRMLKDYVAGRVQGQPGYGERE